MWLHNLLGLPAQTNKERQLLKAIFNQFKSKKIRVFEWGCGLSTLYYSKYLKASGVDFEWHAIDNNKVWYEKVVSKIKGSNYQDNVRIYLKEFVPFWNKPGWGVIPPLCGAFSPKEEGELAYVNFPRTFNDKFDIVVIDARFRRHCFEVARQVVASSGIVVLHDAQKPHYQVGLEKFPYQRFINSGAWAPFQELPNKVWVGVIDNKRLFDSLSYF
jgi:hypothetical protein